MVDQHFLDFPVTTFKAARWTTQLRSDVAAFYADEESDTMNVNEKVSNSEWTNGTDQYGQPYVFNPDNGFGFLTPNLTHGIAIPYTSESPSYLAILELSTRQILAANVLVEPFVHTGQPVIFQKEVSSDDRVNTVDVLYLALPFWLYANPELMRLALKPIFDYQESGLYENRWAMHDLGRYHPNAVGYVDEYVHGEGLKMPIEASGDMILMAYAYHRFTGDSGYLARHYRIMRQWVQFLVDEALFPANRLSTDDFSGRLTNQTNLALKGIIAIEAMSHIAAAINQTDDASFYAATATSYFATWRTLAIDPFNTHALLAYQYRTSWCTLYNVYPALLLDLSVVPKDIYLLQSAWYPQVSQIFGVPLDSRKSWTKSDWEMWAAASALPSARRLFVNAVARWINTTSTHLAMTDHYYTTGTGGYAEYAFIARPVVGGHFSLLALQKAGRHRVLHDRNSGCSTNGL